MSNGTENVSARTWVYVGMPADAWDNLAAILELDAEADIPAGRVQEALEAARIVTEATDGSRTDGLVETDGETCPAGLDEAAHSCCRLVLSLQ